MEAIICSKQIEDRIITGKASESLQKVKPENVFSSVEPAN
jgi:hypothetical protein